MLYGHQMSLQDIILRLQAKVKRYINLNKVWFNRNKELYNYEINCFSILLTETLSSQSKFPNVHSEFNDSSNGFYTSQNN